MSVSEGTGSPQRAFVHSALFFDSDETLRERLVPALRRSLRCGEPVRMVVSRHTEEVVRAALGAEADEFEWVDPQPLYSQRLGFIFERFRRYLAEQYRAGRRVHVVSEPDIPGEPGESVDRIAAYLPYEAMCNDVYAEYGHAVTCLWDSRRCPTLVIENVRSLHSHETTPEGPEPNPDFIVPADYLFGRNQVAMEHPPATVDLDLSLVDLRELAMMRRELRHWAEGHGFGATATEDVVVATNEAVTNGFVHGEPPVRLRCWHHGGTLIAQVDDAGGILLPSVAGYQVTLNAHGRGLWIARQLADVITTSTNGSVTMVRLHFPHSVTHRNAVE